MMSWAVLMFHRPEVGLRHVTVGDLEAGRTVKGLVRPHPALLQGYAHINGLEGRPGFVIAADGVVRERFFSESLLDPGV